jgi:hypothetical protein
MAIVVKPLTASCINRPSNTRRRVLLYYTRPHNIDRLRYEFATFNWSTIMMCIRIHGVYNNFLTIVKRLIETSIPHRYVRIGPKDPSFVTPLITSLLIRRNKAKQMRPIG